MKKAARARGSVRVRAAPAHTPATDWIQSRYRVTLM